MKLGRGAWRYVVDAAALKIAAAVAVDSGAAGVRVIDGDSLVVGSKKNRRWGINAQESGQSVCGLGLA